MSLRVERDERNITIISDDRNAENAALGEALGVTAPHLLPAFDDAPFEDGELRFIVHQDDWQSLLEALEAMDGEAPGITGASIEQVEAWVKELEA